MYRAIFIMFICVTYSVRNAANPLKPPLLLQCSLPCHRRFLLFVVPCDIFRKFTRVCILKYSLDSLGFFVVVCIQQWFSITAVFCSAFFHIMVCSMHFAKKRVPCVHC